MVRIAYILQISGPTGANALTGSCPLTAPFLSAGLDIHCKASKRSANRAAPPKCLRYFGAGALRWLPLLRVSCKNQKDSRSTLPGWSPAVYLTLHAIQIEAL